MKRVALVVAFCSLLASAPWLRPQTFEIQGQPNSPTPPNPGSRKTAGESVGWGSSIEVARLSRAAEQALAKGNAGQAADFAGRALQVAPQNIRLWFLLGYASRLAGRYPQSVEAFQHGLRSEPNSIEGLSGLAQTYLRMGRMQEAKQLLLQVIAANPRRPMDLAMAGELFLRSGEPDRAIEVLQRAEAMQPSAHTEVLLATTFMKQKQPEKAKAMLDRARARGGNTADVLRAVASYYREGHDYAAAAQTLKQIARPQPEVLAELGYTYTLGGDRRQAAETYTQAAAAAPRDIKVQLSAAEAQARVGNYDRAQHYLSLAEALDANDYRLHAIRGDMARASRRNPDAIREYQLALANLPQAGVAEGELYPVQLRVQLAELFRASGDEAGSSRQVEMAQAELGRLDIQGPARPEFLRLRASVKGAGNDLNGADADLREALQLDPQNLNIMVQYGTLLWRLKRPAEARRMYETALAREPGNRYALESLGYLAREQGDNAVAEKYFQELQAAHPDDFVPYLALGDLYTAERRFAPAQDSYEKAFKLAPSNPQIVAGGANAGIEAHQIELAGAWLDRAQGAMKDDVRVQREQERYLFHQGKFLESAQLGRKVLEKIPNDREGSVYLAYDLYNLGRYDEALAVARKYQQVLPREPNFPLVAGHVEKQAQLLSKALDDYSRTIAISPDISQAYINRGYVLNDLQNAEQAALDFQHVLKSEPKNGVAHLGLAFSYLQLHQGPKALDEANSAQVLLGESGSTHMARAGAFRQMRLLPEAEKEYRAALKYSPNDLALHLALADTLYHLRRYPDSITVLNSALAFSPDDAAIYGRLAHSYAHLGNRDLTLRYVQAAEQQQPEASGILLDTGDALLTLGDSKAAMDRFGRALDAPDANRVDARLLIARLMAGEGHWDEARQQISLAFAEARIGEASPITTDNLVQAANLFLAMNEFDLAQKYFERARMAGAADRVVAIGLANTFLAQGDPLAAQAQLASLGNSPELLHDYDYTMAMANVYRQRRDTVHALGLLAQANILAPDDDIVEHALRDVAGEEGLRINQKLSLGSSLTMVPVFDDSTIYTAYSRLFRGSGLITPHSLQETLWINDFRVHQGTLPLITGFFELRNARGTYSVPSQFRFLPVDTYDSIFNGAINPILHLGSRDYLAFSPGLTFTVRRDHISPVPVNQNLFRQSLYVQSSSFWNWISLRGFALHEAGPYTEQNLSSRDLVANLEFQIGHPWGKTALITGYHVRDLLFNPRRQEWFQTSSYAGLQHKFGQKVTASAFAELVRSWAVLFSQFGAAQMWRPAGIVSYRPTRNWEFNANLAWSHGNGDHVYDNMQSGFFISYQKALRRTADTTSGKLAVDYPLQFSIGMQQQDFYNFNGNGQRQFRPVFRLALF